MAAPWISATKLIGLSGDDPQPLHGFPGPGFVPVPLLPSLSVTPAALYAALAKTTALSTASTSMLAALTHSDQILIEALVDDLGTDFLFTAHAEHLGSDIRKALAGRVGAALCHLYMDQLGYAWINFASSIIKTSAALGDFLYGGGSPGSQGLALSEAKGSLSASASAAGVKTTANNAYARQVAPYLGATTPAGRIEYGCAIATAIVPASKLTAGTTACFLHIAHTTPVLATPGSGGGGASAGLGGGDGDLLSVNCALALRNYRAIFRLICAPFVVDLLDRLLERRPLEVVRQRFGRLTTEEIRSQWIVGDPNGHPESQYYRRANKLVPGLEFGLHERSFRTIMNLIRRCARDDKLLEQDILLPNLSTSPRVRDRGDGRPIEPSDDSSVRAQLGDGLAVVDSHGSSFLDDENFVWPS